MSGSSRWPVTWDDAREALLDSALAATPTQRLQWLEAALKLAYDAGALHADVPASGVPQAPPSLRDDPNGRERS